MAKEIKAVLRLLIPGGAATPAPPVGAALGQQGVNIKAFCDQFNAKTADKKGVIIPVVITVYKDKKFDFITKTEQISALIKKRANISKGSAKPGHNLAGSISIKDVEDIAKIKMPDLTAFGLDQAKKIVIGSAKSMGLSIIE